MWGFSSRDIGVIAGAGSGFPHQTGGFPGRNALRRVNMPGPQGSMSMLRAMEMSRRSKTVTVRITAVAFAAACALSVLCGCDLPRNSSTLMSDVRRAEFESAGTGALVLDSELLFRSAATRGPYRAMAGDLLELQMPATLYDVTGELAQSGTIEQIRSFMCRVDTEGAITLPIVGAVPVAGKTAAQIEEGIQRAYYPRYVVSPPAVVTRVAEYSRSNVTVAGAVSRPGVYSLRTDQMSLVTLLMEAGGIVSTGAAAIRITSSTQGEPNSPATAMAGKPLILPVKGMNIPFTDVTLHDGDAVQVEPLSSQVFTVIGLVNRPGTFPYPADRRCRLPEVLATAGGVNLIADPRYVRIYRPTTDGRVVDALFCIRPGEDFVRAMNVQVQPGDVVAVDQTTRTSANMAIAEILSLRAVATWQGGG